MASTSGFSHSTAPPVALTVAGSDPGGGAGIQADLKTFSALGAYGTSVVTALTAQSTRGVTGVHVVPGDFVRQQWRTLTHDVQVDAIKVGMLATAELAEVVGELLEKSPCDVVVLDPVMVAASGDRLLDDDATEAVRRLLPAASLVTPNLPEAAVLLGEEPAGTVGQMRDQAVRLQQLGASYVLLKGGHLPRETDAVDVLAGPGGVVHTLTAPRVETRNTHGTGCSLSSAIAALRARREDWVDAVAEAKEWLTGALLASRDWRIGGGTGPVHHFHALWDC